MRYVVLEISPQNQQERLTEKRADIFRLLPTAIPPNDWATWASTQIHPVPGSSVRWNSRRLQPECDEQIRFVNVGC